jgi:hypothetical protein
LEYYNEKKKGKNNNESIDRLMMVKKLLKVSCSRRCVSLDVAQAPERTVRGFSRRKFENQNSFITSSAKDLLGESRSRF